MNEDFWDARPVLRKLRDHARATLVPPWAVLGVVLARVAAASPVNLVLPPLVGAPASLNLLVALVGPSGAGKGASERSAETFTPLARERLYVAPIGTGEGLAHLFAARRITKDTEGTPEAELVPIRQNVMMTAPEIDILAAQAARQAATIMPTLRQAYSGEQLGGTTADPARSVTVPPMCYHFALVAGVQPTHSGTILNDPDGGTPQRWLWFPTTDMHAPLAPPDDPGPIDVPHIPSPLFDVTDAFVRGYLDPARCYTMRAPVEVHQAVWKARQAMLHGQYENSLDGHALLTRLKVAAALALLDGNRDVNIEDWQLAGEVMRVSDTARAQCVESLRQKDLENAERLGARRAASADSMETHITNATKEKILKIVDSHGKGVVTPWRAIRNGVSHRQRDYVEAAVEELLDVDRALVREHRDGGDFYGRAAAGAVGGPTGLRPTGGITGVGRRPVGRTATQPTHDTVAPVTSATPVGAPRGGRWT